MARRGASPARRYFGGSICRDVTGDEAGDGFEISSGSVAFSLAPGGPGVAVDGFEDAVGKAGDGLCPCLGLGAVMSESAGKRLRFSKPAPVLLAFDFDFRSSKLSAIGSLAT